MYSTVVWDIRSTRVFYACSGRTSDKNQPAVCHHMCLWVQCTYVDSSVLVKVACCCCPAPGWSIQLPAAAASTFVCRLTPMPHMSVWQQKREGETVRMERESEEGSKGKTKRSYFREPGQINFPSDVTAWHTQRLCPFSLLSSHLLSRSLTPQPHSTPILVPPLIFQGSIHPLVPHPTHPPIEWLCMLPSCCPEFYYTSLEWLLLLSEQHEPELSCRVLVGSCVCV